MEYKDLAENHGYKSTPFFRFLSNTFKEGFDELDNISSNFLNFDEFDDLQRIGTKDLLSNNIDGVSEVLYKLYLHFLTPEIDLTPYCDALQVSQFCFYLFDAVKKEEFKPISLYFLQLFIEVIFKDKRNSIIQYCINNNAVEIIMYFTNTIPENYYPLIMIFSYNLYGFLANYITNHTTEFYRILAKVFNEMNDEQYSFLSLLVLVNLLRNTVIEKKELNDHFFKSIIICADSDSPNISISAMWCIYFWFKNSWENASPYINKDFLKMLSKNIRQSQYEDIVKISLHVYSYCWAVSNPLKKSYVEEFFPFDEILELTHCDVDDIASLAIINLNNFISDKNSNFTSFLTKDGFKRILSVLNSGHSQCKLEAGFLITTALDFIPKESIKNFVDNELIENLCEICLIENIELIMKILRFFYIILPNFSWIAAVFEENDFFNEIQSIENEEVYEMANALEKYICNSLLQSEKS